MIGTFASHQAVKLVVRRRRKPQSPDGANLAMSDIDETPAHSVPPSPRAVSPMAYPQPNTPSIMPALSLSSSIASLDPLSRSVPPSPMFHASGVGALSGLSKVSIKDEDEWEEIEVGKGLAQYNSSEIERVKGMKR